MSGEIAEWNDVGGVYSGLRGLIPVVHRRKAHAGELRVSCRFKPAYSRHGIVGLTFGIVAEFPGRGARPPCAVAEQLHGFAPGYKAAILAEFFVPVFRFGIAACVNELLEFAVCHFIAANPVLAELNGRNEFQPRHREPMRSSGNTDHSGRGLPASRELQIHNPGRRTKGLWRHAWIRHLQIVIALFVQFPSIEPHRQTDIDKRCSPKQQPVSIVPRLIRTEVNVDTGRIGIQDNLLRHLRPQPLQCRIVREYAFDLLRQSKCLQPLCFIG